MSEFVGVQTTKGLQKAAASYGGGPAVNPVAIRVGDGGGAPITPSSAMTDLVRRVGDAYPIIASARDATNPQMWRFRTMIPAAAGPFDIREIALFDAAGDMLAIAKHVFVEKRTPAQGAAVELETDILVPFSETAQIVVTIAPDAMIALNREFRAGWMTVDSATLAAPPANPATGATYLVPAGATGAWNGLAGVIAQWIGTMWVSASMPEGHLIADRSKAEDNPLRYLKRAAGGAWVSAAATETAHGFARRATSAEVAAGIAAAPFVTPAQLRALFADAGAVSPTAGSQELPGGLILKFGSLVMPTGAETAYGQMVTFADEFPTAAIMAVATATGVVSTDGWRCIVSVELLTNTGFRAVIDTNGSRPIALPVTYYWMAIGY